MNVRKGDGLRRWVAAGRPVVPSLELRGVVSPILHVSQLAALLGLEAPAQLEAPRLAWDAAAVLDSWVGLIEPLDFATLTRPTPSRGRSLRNLTVNVFHPFELLPAVFDDCRFDWDPDLDTAREAPLRDAAAVFDYARERSRGWREWLLEREPELPGRDPDVESPRGRVTYTTLLSSQRSHAAFHYRQLLAVLADGGFDTTRALSLGSLAELELPAEIF